MKKVFVMNSDSASRRLYYIPNIDGRCKLTEINYTGDLIIQGAREDLENTKISPMHACENYLKFVEQYVDKYLN